MKHAYFVSALVVCVWLAACVPAERAECSGVQNADDIARAEVLVRAEMQKTYGPRFLPAIDKTYDLVRAEQCGDQVWFEYHPKQVTAEGTGMFGADLIYVVTNSTGAVANLTSGD